MRRVLPVCLALSLVPSAAGTQAPASKALSDALADACLHFSKLRPTQLALELSVSRADRLVLKQWAASDRYPGTLLNIWSLGTEHRAVWVAPAASGQGSVLAFWTPTRTGLL